MKIRKKKSIENAVDRFLKIGYHGQLTGNSKFYVFNVCPSGKKGFGINVDRGMLTSHLDDYSISRNDIRRDDNEWKWTHYVEIKDFKRVSEVMLYPTKKEK